MKKTINRLTRSIEKLENEIYELKIAREELIKAYCSHEIVEAPPGNFNLWEINKEGEEGIIKESGRQEMIDFLNRINIRDDKVYNIQLLKDWVNIRMY